VPRYKSVKKTLQNDVQCCFYSTAALCRLVWNMNRVDQCPKATCRVLTVTLSEFMDPKVLIPERFCNAPTYKILRKQRLLTNKEQQNKLKQSALSCRIALIVGTYLHRVRIYAIYICSNYTMSLESTS